MLCFLLLPDQLYSQTQEEGEGGGRGLGILHYKHISQTQVRTLSKLTEGGHDHLLKHNRWDGVREKFILKHVHCTNVHIVRKKLHCVLCRG